MTVQVCLRLLKLMQVKPFDSKCSYCKKEYVYERKAGHTKKICNTCIVNNRRFHLKKKCIAYKGMKCSICGYSKCDRALTFHHLNPKEKDFNISGSHCKKWEDIKRELDKCILLCMNCHMEEHEKQGLKPEEEKIWIPRKASKPPAPCTICGKVKTKDTKGNLCNSCWKENKPTKISWPSKEELQKIVWEKPSEEIAKELGVSGKAIEKRCKRLGITKPTRGYWAKVKQQQKIHLDL